MATPLKTCMKVEQHSVIGVLSSEGVKLINIHWRMKIQYSDTRLALQQVHGWSRKFWNDPSSASDSLCPCQAHFSRKQKLNTLRWKTCQVTVNETDSPQLPHLWTIQRCDGWKDFQVRIRGATDGTLMSVHWIKRFFLNAGIHALWKCWKTCRGDKCRKIMHLHMKFLHQ